MIEQDSSVGLAAEKTQDHVSNTRLQNALDALARFGGRDDGGVARETLTEIDLSARRHLIEQARALGCEVEMDDCATCSSVAREGRRCPLCSPAATPIRSQSAANWTVPMASSPAWKSLRRSMTRGWKRCGRSK